MKSKDEKSNPESEPSELPKRIRRPSRRDYYKQITSKTKDQIVRRPTIQKILDRHWQSLQSEDDLLLIGEGTDGEVYISEEQRDSHLHIIGAPGEGKSKFLEYLIRHDIDRLASGDERACGLCLIDPSAQGDTVANVLAYCAEIDFRKVLLVDPFLLREYGKVAPINPLNYNPSQIPDSVSSLMDAFRVLFDVKDPAKTAILETYLPALFSLLHHGGFTLHDAIYFTNFDDWDYFRHREFIFGKLDKNVYAQKDLTDILSAFKNEVRYREFGSTVRRLNTLYRSPALDLILSHHKGVDFTKLISKGWVILVNVYTDEGVDTLQSRLLATLVINQIISAIERLRRNGYSKPYYLYIDEVGEYANQKVARILDLKRKIGLRFVLAHQFPGQFEDQRVKQSVENNTKMKAAFYISSALEREKVIKLLNYGGQITDRDVVFALSSQKARHMVWRSGKEAPHVIRVPDVPKARGDVKAYLDQLFAQPWYYTPKQILEDNAKRFEGLDQVSTERPAKPNRKAGGKGSEPKRGHRVPEPEKDGKGKAGAGDPKAKPRRSWKDRFLEIDERQKSAAAGESKARDDGQ